MLKTISTLLGVAAVALAALYFGGGYHSFDPSEQARRARSAIHPGMTYQQVLDRVGAPVRYGRAQSHRVPGREDNSGDQTVLWSFNRENFEADIAGEVMRDGFLFYYRFTAENAFWVIFHANGRVSQVVDQERSTWGPLVERRLRL